MDVVVAGGHGRVALRLLGLLAERGDRARGLIRNPEHAADLEAAGAEPVIADLEQLEPPEIARHLVGTHALVFAAGAGAGSGPERKRAVDLGAAVKLIEAARAAGFPRYVMVSAIGVTRPDRWPAEMRPYYEAKAKADRALERSGLEFTIVRPGGLTDDPGTGLVEAAPALERSGQIPRDDVAATLLALLDSQNTTGVAFDVISGETPIAEAVAAL
jgi:uncharacterized protein YbjT (DUF2867 family)